MSEANKHTPGPWTIVRRGPGCWIETPIEQWVCGVLDDRNAVFIAALPDIFAALKALRSAAAFFEDDDALDAAKALADAAIAKAEGAR